MNSIDHYLKRQRDEDYSAEKNPSRSFKKTRFNQPQQELIGKEKLFRFGQFISEILNKVENEVVIKKLTFLSKQACNPCKIEIYQKQLSKRLKHLDVNFLQNISFIPKGEEFYNINEIILLKDLLEVKKNPDDRERDFGYSGLSIKLSRSNCYEKSLKVADKIMSTDLREKTLFQICCDMIEDSQFAKSLEVYLHITNLDYKESFGKKFVEMLALKIVNELSCISNGSSLNYLSFACDLSNHWLKVKVFREVYSRHFGFSSKKEEEDEVKPSPSENKLNEMLSFLEKSLKEMERKERERNFVEAEKLTYDEIFYAVSQAIRPEFVKRGDGKQARLYAGIAKKIANLIGDEKKRNEANDEITSSLAYIFKFQNVCKSFKILQELICEKKKNNELKGLVDFVYFNQFHTTFDQELFDFIVETTDSITDVQIRSYCRVRLLGILLYIKSEAIKDFVFKYKDMEFVLPMLEELQKNEEVFNELKKAFEDDIFYHDPLLYTDSKQQLSLDNMSEALALAQQIIDPRLRDTAFYNFCTIAVRTLCLSSLMQPIPSKGQNNFLLPRNTYGRILKKEQSEEDLIVQAYFRIDNKRIRGMALDQFKQLSPQVAQKIKAKEMQ